MTILTLTAQQDHLEKVAKTRDPVKALSEFVWNGLDANATNVDVRFGFNSLGGIESISVTDNGDGITPLRASTDFSNLGDSWKKTASRTRSQRALHGKEGRGRLRFFSLAQKAIWHSTFAVENKLVDLSIEIEAASLGKSTVSETTPSAHDHTGTHLLLSNLKETFDWLASRKAFLELSAVFAPYLLRYPSVSISYNGERIRPADTISVSYDFPTEPIVCPHRTVKDLAISVVEWNSHVESRRIHLGGENGIVLGSQPANVVAPGFEYSAYAYSAFFQEIADANLLELDDLTDPDFSYIVGYIRDALTDYFRQRHAERSKGLIEELRAEGAYPYDGEPRDEIERKERQVFEIATYAVSSYSKDFSKADASLRKMTLTFLKEAIRHNPDSLSTILRAVVNLPKTKQDEFSSLLEKTKLGSIITASSLIAERVVALEVLKGMVFNPEYRHSTRERGELDVIIRDNTWMFGERFHIALSEVGLTRVMERVSQELRSKSPKKRIMKVDGSSARLDSFLGRIVPHPDQTKREFIVIELKRPSLKVGRKELDQLEDYVNALITQPDFSHTDTQWTFFLVTGEYDASIVPRITQKDRPVGLFLETANSAVWVKTWAELTRDCDARLHFIQDKLRIEVSADEINSKIAALRASVLKEDRTVTSRFARQAPSRETDKHP
ncbi:ATP-binding protein [Bradyrhizobium jicamae]|uniref:ATP-binding protein n=1 Tax=Bradyrhizobium jicamae TaxID=280332 RepID=UPI0007C73DAC|nr:ATP-binding protein [Bradyrhizobium jicamae]